MSSVTSNLQRHFLAPSKRVRLALLGLVALAAFTAGALYGTRGDGTQEEAAIPVGAYVDPGSMGGRCSDRYSPAEAKSSKTPWCTLARGIQATPRSTVLVLREGDYPKTTVVRRAGLELTVRAADGERVTIGELRIGSARRFAVEGVRFAGPVFIGPAAAGIRLSDSSFTNGIAIEEGSRDILLETSRISNPDGYGVVFGADREDPPIRRVTIRRNRFASIGVDAIQAKRFDGLAILENEFTRIAAHEPGGHPDVLQTYLGGRGLDFSRNYIHDVAAQGVFIKDGRVDGARIEQNLIVRVSGGFAAINLYDVTGLQLVNNTTWAGGAVVLRGGIAGAKVVNNVFESLNDDGSVRYAVLDYNLITSGNRAGRGRHDARGRPTFTASFELAQGSPGVDAASAEFAPATDRRGRRRIDDPTAPNAGAGGTQFGDLGANERHP